METALNTYNSLSPEIKAELFDEKALLDDLLDEIEIETPDVEVSTPTVVTSPVIVSESKDYEDLLKVIISNQEILIKQNESCKNNVVETSSFRFSRVFNIIIIVLIVIVALIWIYYGINTLYNL